MCEHLGVNVSCATGAMQDDWYLVSWFQRFGVSASYTALTCTLLVFVLNFFLDWFSGNFTLVFFFFFLEVLSSLLTHSLMRLRVETWTMYTVDYLEMCSLVSTNRAKVISFQFGNPSDKQHFHREFKFISWTKQSDFFFLRTYYH